MEGEAVVAEAVVAVVVVAGAVAGVVTDDGDPLLSPPHTHHERSPKKK